MINDDHSTLNVWNDCRILEILIFLLVYMYSFGNGLKCFVLFNIVGRGMFS